MKIRRNAIGCSPQTILAMRVFEGREANPVDRHQKISVKTEIIKHLAADQISDILPDDFLEFLRIQVRHEVVHRVNMGNMFKSIS